MSPQLQIKNLSHQFTNGITALNQINIAFAKGEFVVLAGANGSGKTVFLRHLNGLLTPTTGAVLLNGVDIFANIVDTRTKVGLVFQDPDSQFVGQTVKEDIAFGPENLQLAEAVVEERVAQAMETVGLTDYAERRPYQLSGGEKRRLAIAGVLAMHPEIIVFDEPFTGLDYDGVVQVLEAVLQLQAMQKTIIVVTHDLGKIMAHADRLVVMNKGEIVLDGTPIEMINEVENYGIKIPHGIEHDLKTMTWLK